MSNHLLKDTTHTHTLPNFSLDIPIFAKIYDFYKNLSQFLTVFPKTKRYTLGQKIDQTSLDIVELTITAGYLPREQKLPILQKISTKLDFLKILLRISWETKCLNNNKFLTLTSQLIEIGKMLGGRIKTVR